MKYIKSYGRLILILCGLAACAAGFMLFYQYNVSDSTTLFILSIVSMSAVFLFTAYEIILSLKNSPTINSETDQEVLSQVEIRTELDESPETEITTLDQSKPVLEIITEKEEIEEDLPFSDESDENNKTITTPAPFEIIGVDDSNISPTIVVADELEIDNVYVEIANILDDETTDKGTDDLQVATEPDDESVVDSAAEVEFPSEIQVESIVPLIPSQTPVVKIKNSLKNLFGNSGKHTLNNVYYGDWIELEDSYGIFSDLKEINVENRQSSISKLVGGEVLKYDFYIWEGHPAVHILYNKESIGVLPKALSAQLWELKDHIDKISVKTIRRTKVNQISVNISLKLSAKEKLIQLFGEQVSESTSN